ncbi:MAG: primosomal protein N', partial [Pseudomonadota bacterium]
MPTARILFPMPLPEPFDYLVPDEMTVEPGSYVRAPLGKYERTGVVWEVVETDPERELKTIESVFPTPPMPATMRRFIAFCARYNVAGTGQVLAMALRSKGGLSPSPTQTIYLPTGHRTNRMTPAREKVL